VQLYLYTNNSELIIFLGEKTLFIQPKKSILKNNETYFIHYKKKCF